MENSINSKPFLCSSSGCEQSFDSQDHLNIHVKKHEVMLNFDTTDDKPNIFVADQTPTPTRFLRTCDEIGVFEEILNPFEQTFRRAIESNGRNPSNIPSTTTNTSTNNVDDTLHTPHILPNFCNAANCPTTEKVKDESIKVDNVHKKTIFLRLDSVKEKVKDETKHENVVVPMKTELPEIKNLSESPSKTDASYILSKYPPIAPALMPTVTTTFVALTNTTTIPPDQVKQKLKARLLSHQSICVGPPLILAKKDALTATISCENKSKKATSARTLRNKKNVEAAKRYRERLKQKQEDLAQKNVELSEQNRKLREENKRLKRFILNCKNCKIILDNNS